MLDEADSDRSMWPERRRLRVRWILSDTSIRRRGKLAQDHMFDP
jgi:hypothetical protein